VQREGIYLREDAVYALNALVGWLQRALDEVEDMPRGWNVGWLVAALDEARKRYTGENIVRSAKDESSREYITTTVAAWTNYQKNNRGIRPTKKLGGAHRIIMNDCMHSWQI
jgi:hypothetical protein